MADAAGMGNVFWRAGALSGDLSKWDVSDETGVGKVRWRAEAYSGGLFRA